MLASLRKEFCPASIVDYLGHGVAIKVMDEPVSIGYGSFKARNKIGRQTQRLPCFLEELA